MTKGKLSTTDTTCDLGKEARGFGVQRLWKQMNEARCGEEIEINGLGGTIGSECTCQKSTHLATERQIRRYPTCVPSLDPAYACTVEQGLTLTDREVSQAGKASQAAESCGQKMLGHWEIGGSMSTS